MLRSQAFQRALDERVSPTALEECFGIALNGRFQAVTLFRLKTIERKNDGAAAALKSLSVPPFVGQEMRQRMHQKRSEPPAPRVGHGELISSQQRREERLCQVSCGFRIVPAPADKRVQRIPIRATKVG